MARVELQNVTKVYPGGVTAVDGIDLRIEDREFVVLVGPSGCGKTTTLRMVAGLEEITGGTIRIGERVVNDVPPKDRDIAMVFQNYALYPHMTVFKNMAFGLRLRMLPNVLWRMLHPFESRKIKQEIRDRVLRAAEVLDISHLLDRKPKALSGGQRQRVAVGRAIVREPAAFLFDEPLSNLDAKLRVTTRAELKRLHQSLKTTTVYVTHDQEEAMTLGDRIVVMRAGKIQQADTPMRVYHHPANRFVAGFIGMPPMNFFDGAIRETGGKLVFEEGRVVGRGAGPGQKVEADELTFPGGGFRLTVPARLHQSLVGWSDKRVVLGVRPEHLHLRPVGSDVDAGENHGDLNVIDAKVNVIEPLGNAMDLYMETSLHGRVVARVEADGPAAVGIEVGSRVRLFADLRKIHCFGPGETGMNLSLTRNEPSHAHA